MPIVTFAEYVSPCAVLSCAHFYEERYIETSLFVSIEYHRITESVVATCKLCGSEIILYDNSYLEEHEIDEESLIETYSYTYISNELHRTVTNTNKFCLCCGEINEESYSDDLHEFDNSVDPEVDMEGVCIYCGEMIYW